MPIELIYYDQYLNLYEILYKYFMMLIIYYTVLIIYVFIIKFSQNLGFICKLI
jgi:hypothetical protein